MRNSSMFKQYTAYTAPPWQFYFLARDAHIHLSRYTCLGRQDVTDAFYFLHNCNTTLRREEQLEGIYGGGGQCREPSAEARNKLSGIISLLLGLESNPQIEVEINKLERQAAQLQAQKAAAARQAQIAAQQRQAETARIAEAQRIQREQEAARQVAEIARIAEQQRQAVEAQRQAAIQLAAQQQETIRIAAAQEVARQVELQRQAEAQRLQQAQPREAQVEILQQPRIAGQRAALFQEQPQQPILQQDVHDAGAAQQGERSLDELLLALNRLNPNLGV